MSTTDDLLAFARMLLRGGAPVSGRVGQSISPGFSGTTRVFQVQTPAGT